MTDVIPYHQHQVRFFVSQLGRKSNAPQFEDSYLLVLNNSIDVKSNSYGYVIVFEVLTIHSLIHKQSQRFYASSSTSSPLPYLDTEHIFEQGAACEYTSDKNNAFLSRVPIRPRTFRNELFLTGKLRHCGSYFLPIDADTWDRTCSPKSAASNANSKEVSSGQS